MRVGDTTLPPRVRAQMAEVSKAMANVLEGHGAQWGSAWDGLQWSPKGLFEEMTFNGRERMTLAALSMSRGYGDRRWTTEDQLGTHGYQPRRDDRGVLLRDGMGWTVAFNAGSVVKAHGQGVRHGTPVPAEDVPAPLDRGAVRRTVRYLASGTVCPVVRDCRERVLPVVMAGLVVVPRDPSWGGSIGDLGELVEAVALVALTYAGRPCASAEAEVSASMACAMALSDLGVPPSEACSGRKATVRGSQDKGAAKALAGDAESLMRCADAAEGAASRILKAVDKALRSVDESDCQQAGPAEKRVDASGVKGLGADATRAIDHGDSSKPPACSRVWPQPGTSVREPFGRYRLRDVVAESERASLELAKGNDMGGRRDD